MTPHLAPPAAPPRRPPPDWEAVLRSGGGLAIVAVLLALSWWRPQLLQKPAAAPPAAPAVVVQVGGTPVQVAAPAYRTLATSITPINSISDPSSGFSYSGQSFNVACVITGGTATLYPAVHDGTRWQIFQALPCVMDSAIAGEGTCAMAAPLSGGDLTWNVLKSGTGTLSDCTAEGRDGPAPVSRAAPSSGPGSGTVTSIACGTGLSCSPDPITVTGTIALSTPVAATAGGTGQTTITTGDLLYGSAANTWSRLPDVATGQVLTSGGVGVAPAWSASPTLASLTLAAGAGGLSCGSGTGDWTMPTGAGSWTGASGKALSLTSLSASIALTASGSNFRLNGGTGGTLEYGGSPVLTVGSSAVILAAGKSLSMAAGAGGLFLGIATGASMMPTGTFTWTGSSNSDFLVTSSGISGNIQLSAGGGGLVSLNSTDRVELNYSSGTRLRVSQDLTLRPLVTPPAGGSTDARVLLGDEAAFGIYYGTGAPTVSAAKGSIYLRRDGSGTNDRMYINTDGGTTWTAVTTAS